MSIDVLKSICVDFSDESLYQYITVFSEEIYSRTIEITPLNNGEEYIIPAETTARLEARKPDNKPILLDSKIDFTNNKIYIELTPKCLDTPGVTSCQIGLYGVDNRFIASSYFYIDVYRSVLGGNGSVNHNGCGNHVVESSPEYQSFRIGLLALDKEIKESQKATDDAINATKKAESVVGGAISATEEAKEATSNAIIAANRANIASENTENALSDAKESLEIATEAAEKFKDVRIVQSEGNDRGVVISQAVVTELLGAIRDDIADLKYIEIKINSFSNDINIAEMGSTVNNVLLTWSINKTAKTLTIDGETVTGSSKQITNANLKTNKTYSLKAVDERDKSATATTTIYFYNGILWGSSAEGTYNSDFINSLSKSVLSNTRARTITVTTNANYIYYALPTRLGNPSFVMNNFTTFFEKVGSSIMRTNQSGYTEAYDLWRSPNSYTGNITVIVS